MFICEICIYLISERSPSAVRIYNIYKADVLRHLTAAVYIRNITRGECISPSPVARIYIYIRMHSDLAGAKGRVGAARVRAIGESGLRLSVRECRGASRAQ